jgi:hypothetical protein
MRFSTVVAAVYLGLLPICNARADAPGPAAPQATQTTPAAQSTPAPDAAARHAKRAACLKEAKAKKLVGAEKTSFVKTCTTAP